MRTAPPLVVLAMGAAASCGGGSDAVVGQGPATTTIVEVQAAVFTPRCALSGCHVGTSAPFGLVLSSAGASASSLVGVPAGEKPTLDRVAPSDAANSYLYWKLSGNPNIGGEQMPLTGGPLSDSDLALVASWINGGAK